MKHLSIILLCAGLLQACMLNLPDPIADMGYENIEKGPFIKYDKYSVSSDNNGDEIINKGETVGLQVWLKNIGTSAAKQVKATFSTTSAYASSFTPTAQINYGDMAAGSSVDYGYSIYYTNRSYTIQFTISSSTPVGTQIPINISITDESGNTWTESFNVPVEATSAQIVYDKYSVYSDSNGDKIINKGETVGLQVWLKNIGTSAAKQVKATFSTANPYASSLTPTTQINYGDMAAGSSEMVDYNGYSIYYTNRSYTIQFTISSSTPVGTQIPINISITDESGNTWTESFNVPVEATSAQIVYDKYSVYSDSNGDKIINKGETVTLEVYLKNIGSSTAKGVKATFSTISTYASSFTPTAQVNYGDMAAGNSRYGNTDIRFTISSSTPAGTQIPINISITDENGNTWTESFNVPVEATNAQIVYDKYSVYSDSNGDEIVNNGETVGLQVWLKNIGTSAAKQVKATFSTANPYASSLTPTTQINYGDMAAGSSEMADYNGYSTRYTIQFTISSSMPAGTQIPINISITDESGNTWTESFNVTVVKSIDTTPPNAYSTTTWVYGTQTWSDRIVASPSNCSATEYKVYDGRYYYSWTCAYNNRGNFCPSPWRMPSRSDFSTLVSNTNYTTLISAWGYGGYAKGSSMNEVNSDAYYWSSTQYDNLNAYFLYYYNGGLGVSVYYTYTKDVGMQVRCVKD